VTPKQLSGLFNLRGKVALGLGPMERLLDRLNHPEQNKQIIHFAGTNGKGSTLVAVEALLIASGYSVTSFISPHLVEFNERFRLQGEPVSDAGLHGALEQVCQSLGVQIADLEHTDPATLGASFFEISFAMALLIGQASDWLLVETGLGGRLDATNVLQSPKGCVITSIGLDHMEYLGDTLGSITGEKLGILKPGAAVFLAPQAPEVTLLVRQKAAVMGLTLFEANQEQIQGMTLGLKGAHQQENLATACLVYQELCPPQKQMDAQTLALCLSSLSWPGRLEFIGPDVLVDGAHNQGGFNSLIAYLKANHRGKKILLGVGWMGGKALFEGLDLSGLDVTFIPLSGTYPGAEAHPELALSPHGPTLEPKRVALAYQEWKDGVYEGFDLLVIAGSLYLIGELKAFLLSYRETKKG